MTRGSPLHTAAVLLRHGSADAGQGTTKKHIKFISRRLNIRTLNYRARHTQRGFIKLHLPSAAILLSTVMWGTWWIPLRKLDELGAGTAWLLIAGVALPALLFLPRFRHSLRAIAHGGWPLFMLGEPITRARLVSIVLGLFGMWVILGGDTSTLIPRPQDLAEWMGLLAGVCWAFGMVYVQRTRDTRMMDLALPVFVCFAITFAMVTMLPGGRSWAFPVIESWPIALLWVALIAVLWHIPAILLTLFGATEVEPGRVAILLMMEVVIGVGSAALLSGDPFGTREIIGTVCVMCASVTDFLLPALFARQRLRQVSR